MKKSFLLLLVITTAFVVKAQSTATSLSENFNVSCLSAPAPPANWNIYNPIATSVPLGEWTCGPGEGRESTPGILCTGTYSASFNLDTSFLITPQLDLSSYTGRVFLHFDSKTSNFHLGGRLAVLVADSPSFMPGTPPPTDLASVMFPVIGNNDSSDWVTHEVELTPYEHTGKLYLAFRYTSSTTSGNTWYLDNINTTTESLYISNVSRDKLPLKVIGQATSSQITLSYTIAKTGRYDIMIYDMVGRIVYKGQVSAGIGTYAHMVNDLSLQPGMYLIKMGNGDSYGTAKAMVQ